MYVGRTSMHVEYNKNTLQIKNRTTVWIYNPTIKSVLNKLVCRKHTCPIIFTLAMLITDSIQNQPKSLTTDGWCMTHTHDGIFLVPQQQQQQRQKILILLTIQRNSVKWKLSKLERQMPHESYLLLKSLCIKDTKK